jgi:hypothetical protein
MRATLTVMGLATLVCLGVIYAFSPLAMPPAVAVPVHATPAAIDAIAATDDRPLAITFDHLKFELAEGETFTRSLIKPTTDALAGRRVRVRGYIHPLFNYRMTGLAQVLLVRDDGICCFGPEPPLCDCIGVTMESGHTTSYTLRPIEVEGTLLIEEGGVRPDGNPGQVYRMVEALVVGQD